MRVPNGNTLCRNPFSLFVSKLHWKWVLFYQYETVSQQFSLHIFSVAIVLPRGKNYSCFTAMELLQISEDRSLPSKA